MRPTALHRKTVDYVMSRKACGTSAKELAGRFGIGEETAKSRLRDARLAIGGIVCCGRGAGARWVAEPFVKEFKRRRDEDFRRREVRRVARYINQMRTEKFRQRVVPAAEAKRIVTRAPRSVFDLARASA